MDEINSEYLLKEKQLYELDQQRQKIVDELYEIKQIRDFLQRADKYPAVKNYFKQ